MQGTIERPPGLVAEQFDYEARRYNDTVTWLAEVVDGNMRTPFEYRWDGQELYAGDGGGLGDIFDDSIVAAETLPAYEMRRRLIEKEEYKDMLGMMHGELPNTMVVVSDFPPELMGATEDVGGYNTVRKQTMLRVITKTPAGTLMMYSQTLDGSNRRALEAIYEYLGNNAEAGELLGQRRHAELSAHEQELLTDQLTRIYDRSMQAQYGGDWYAGRQDVLRQNTYDFVCKQTDLLHAYLVDTTSFTGGFRDYSLAAAMKDRYKQRKDGFVIERTTAGVAGHVMAIEEMDRAGAMAQARGDTQSGCGFTIEADSSNMSARAQAEASGYGNQSDKKGSLPDDKHGSRYFKCPKGHDNTRWVKNELLDHCQTPGCMAKVSCK